MKPRHLLSVALFIGVVSGAAAETPGNSLGAPPPLEVYGSLPATDDVALSPDASRVALVADKAGQRMIYDYNLTTGAAAANLVQYAKLRNLFWVDSDHVLATASRSQYAGGAFEEWFGVIMNLPKKTARGIFDAGGGIEGDYHRIVRDGQPSVTASMGSCLYSINLDTTTSHLIDCVKDGYAMGWVVRPDATLVSRAIWDDKTKSWSLQFMAGPDGHQAWKTVFSQISGLDPPSLMGLGQDGNSVLLYVRTGDLANSYVEVAPDGTFGKPLPVDGFNAGPIFNPMTGHLAGFASEKEGVVSYSFSDPQMAKLPGMIKKAFPDYPITEIRSFADDPRKMIVFAEGGGDPGTFYFIDFQNGKSRAIGETYPRVPTEWVAEQEAITYPAADGTQIHAIVTYPPGREGDKLPLIVLPHGGPMGIHDKLGFDWMVQALASRGYVVLQPNYRGSGGYTEAFKAAGNGEWGRKMQTDLSDGVRALVSDGLIDAKRVCIVGASYGGYAALAGATLDTGVYRCAVDIAGISDVHDMIFPYGGDKSKTAQASSLVLYWKRMVGDDPATWSSVSPDKLADRVTIPLLMIHGKDDSVVPITQTYAMRDAMRKAGKPFDIVLLQDEDHWLSKAPTRLQALQATMDFLAKNNPAY